MGTKPGGLTATPRILKVARAGKDLRWYIYAWRGGPLIRVAAQPARPKLTREDIAAIATAHEADRQPKDTVHGLSTRWQNSREWKGFAESTRTLWGDCAGRIEAKFGSAALRVFGDPRSTSLIVKWRDKLAETRGLRTADEHIKVLSQMLAWGQLRGLVLCNPAAPVPRLWKGGNREEIIWTDEDCAAFDAVPKMPQYLIDVRRLAALTGLRRADLCAVTWDEVGDTHIGRTAKKKSAGKRRRTIMPIVPGLKALLAELRTRPRKPGVETVLVGAKGGPLAPKTISSQFATWSGKANGGQGIIHAGTYDDEPDRRKALHDLRGTFATKLMTLPGGGLTDDQIATIMGWSVGQVAAIRKTYVDEAAIVVAIGRRIADALENRVENDATPSTISG